MTYLDMKMTTINVVTLLRNHWQLGIGRAPCNLRVEMEEVGMVLGLVYERQNEEDCSHHPTSPSQALHPKSWISWPYEDTADQK
jgi:hypothetical protein